MASDTESDNTVSTDDDDDDEQPLTHVTSLKSRKEKKVTRSYILNVFVSFCNSLIHLRKIMAIIN